MISANRREILSVGLALPLVTAAGAALAADPGGAPIARTRAGKVRGAMNDGIAAFKGIRYGATTEGRRFQPPLPPKPWGDVVDVLDYANQSPQPRQPFEGVSFFKGVEIVRPNSEDCLFLNVWTPGLRDGKKRPVMVWLHGGGYSAGSGASTLYDGTRLSKRGDVVVVTINHRLNVFGYLYLGDNAGAQFADSGNAGTLDQILALKWVRDNITEFGGDPGNVTIFGESGGGGKVGTLMGTPSAKGLFHRAVIQSGSMLKRSSKEDAWAITRDFMGKLGLGEGDARRLAALPADDLVKATATLASGMRLGPVIDGRTLMRHPFAPDGPEESRDVPLLVGVNKDEMVSLAPIFSPPDQSPFDVTFEQLPERLAPLLQGIDADTVIGELKSIYPYARASDLFFTTSSWAMFRNDMILQAERKSALGGAPAFAYLLAWESPADGGKWKSPHALEMPFVFDNIAGGPSMVGPAGGQQQRLADVMSEAWIRFARTGDPGWPAYDAQRRMTMVFDSSSKVVSDPDQRERKLFEGRVRSMFG